MLEKGLFKASPEIVFKVIMSIKLENLCEEGKDGLVKIAESLGDSNSEVDPTPFKVIAPLREVSTHLINIWNTHI